MSRLVPSHAKFDPFGAPFAPQSSREQRTLCRVLSTDKHVTIIQHLISKSVAYLFPVAYNSYGLLIRPTRRAAPGLSRLACLFLSWRFAHCFSDSRFLNFENHLCCQTKTTSRRVSRSSHGSSPTEALSARSRSRAPLLCFLPYCRRREPTVSMECKRQVFAEFLLDASNSRPIE